MHGLVPGSMSDDNVTGAISPCWGWQASPSHCPVCNSRQLVYRVLVLHACLLQGAGSVGESTASGASGRRGRGPADPASTSGNGLYMWHPTIHTMHTIPTATLDLLKILVTFIENATCPTGFTVDIRPSRA